MFSMSLLRRLSRDDVPTKGEASRTRGVRARRNPVGLEPLEERQLLATSMFMQIGDGTVVHGPSTFSYVPNGSFALDSFGWGVSNPATVGSGSSSHRISAPNVSVTKDLDTASTSLFAATTTAQSFGTAKVLMFNTSLSNPTEIFEYDFTNLVVTSAQLSGSTSTPLPIESDTFSFSKVQIHYWAITTDGSQGTEYSAAWDFSRNLTASALSTLTAAFRASNGLDRSAGVHAAPRVKSPHRAKAAGVNHRLANDRAAGSQFLRSHRISAVATSLVHGNQVAGL